MTPDELKRLESTEPPVAMIGTFPGRDGTLLFGYDTDRRTRHVYQEDGELHLLVYGLGEPHAHEHGRTLPAGSLVPSKRLYPEACDAGFCARLRALGIHMTFTTFGSLASRPDGRGMVGKTLSDLEAPLPAGP